VSQCFNQEQRRSASTEQGGYNIYDMASNILLRLGADHGCNGSCARVTGSRPVAWVGFEDDHLNTIGIDDWARLGDRACGYHIDVR